MSFEQDLQQFTHDAIIVLYELDISELAGVSATFRFHDEQLSSGQSIALGGKTYTPVPIQAQGFSKTSQGQQPRPTISVSSLFTVQDPNTGELLPVGRLGAQYSDFRGAIVRRRRILAKYLDGQPLADPGKQAIPDVFRVERKTEESSLYVSYELASALDFGEFQIPARYMATTCPWRYKGAECGWIPVAGKYFDTNDRATSAINDDCGKRVRSCEKRFGVNPQAGLPHGGFPGLKVAGR